MFLKVYDSFRKHRIEHAEGGSHVLVGRHARNRRFVQAQRGGDLAQHQRAHRDGAVREKPALPLDDGLGDALYGLKALAQVAYQPPRVSCRAAESIRLFFVLLPTIVVLSLRRCRPLTC